MATDENGLYYMRTRYYNPEIKRFINQDILTGTIGNSNSLNRYSYVEGNPISYTDPFGLSPLEWIHTGFDILGCLPGGEIFDLINAGIYLAEGNEVEALKSLVFMIPGTDLMGKAAKYAEAGGKLGKQALAAAEIITITGRTLAPLLAAEDIGKLAGGMIDKYLVQGQEISAETALEIFCLAAGGLQLGTSLYSAFKLPDLIESYNFDSIISTGLSARYEIAPVNEALISNTPMYSSKSNGGSRRLLSDYLGKPTNIENGKFYSIINEAGGQVFVSTENIIQLDIAKIVSTTDGNINIITGRHGDWMDNIILEPDFYIKDMERFGNMQNVKVFDFSELDSEKIKELINSGDTTILGWCYSEYSSFMRELFQ